METEIQGTLVERRGLQLKFLSCLYYNQKKENHIYEKEDIEKYFERHFKELYSSSNPNFPRDLENLISPCIVPEENEDLMVCLGFSSKNYGQLLESKLSKQ